MGFVCVCVLCLADNRCRFICVYMFLQQRKRERNAIGINGLCGVHFARFCASVCVCSCHNHRMRSIFTYECVCVLFVFEQHKDRPNTHKHNVSTQMQVDVWTHVDE